MLLHFSAFLKVIMVAFSLFVCASNSTSLLANEAKKEEEGAAKEPVSKVKKLPGGYVHNWTPFPTLEAKGIFSEELLQIPPEKGYASVVIFVASWCERCQRLIGRFEQMRSNFKDLPVRLVYVFSHDTLADAQGFAKEHKVAGQGLMGSHEVLKGFHNPPLPSIYIGDRRGWLLQRYLDADVKDIVETERILKLMTAI